MSNYQPDYSSPEQPPSRSETPFSLKLGIGGAVATMVLGAFGPGAIQSWENRPQPTTVAEMTVPVALADVEAGRTDAKVVQAAVCGAVPELIKQLPNPTGQGRIDGQGELDKFGATMANDCTSAANELMANAEGAQSLAGQEVTVSLEEWPDNGGMYIKAEQVVG